jgi:hypothetical protein
MAQSFYTSSFPGVPEEEQEQGKEQHMLFPAMLFVAVMLLLLMSTGCAPIDIESEGVEAEVVGSVLFQDDFSNPPTGWGTWNRDGASVEYHNGGLRILINQTQFDLWSVAGQKFEDAVIEVDAMPIGGPDDNDFGLVCRYQDKDNFYMLVISSDGYYGIARMKAGQYSMIGVEQLQYSDAILKGEVTNHLRADCIGSTLTLYVNGKKLIEAQDQNFAGGDVGVLAGAYNTQGVDILFDNFVVKKP